MERGSTRDDGVPLSRKIIETVADETAGDSTTLDPLYHAIDPDALDSLFRAGSTGRVEFTYEGCIVEAFSNGRVVVRVDR